MSCDPKYPGTQNFSLLTFTSSVHISHLPRKTGRKGVKLGKKADSTTNCSFDSLSAVLAPRVSGSGTEQWTKGLSLFISEGHSLHPPQGCCGHKCQAGCDAYRINVTEMSLFPHQPLGLWPEMEDPQTMVIRLLLGKRIVKLSVFCLLYYFVSASQHCLQHF